MAILEFFISMKYYNFVILIFNLNFNILIATLYTVLCVDQTVHHPELHFKGDGQSRNINKNIIFVMQP